MAKAEAAEAVARAAEASEVEAAEAEVSEVEAEAESEAAEAVAEAAEAEAEAEAEAAAAEAEAEATRCSLEEEEEMAALYGHHTKQLRVFGWTPAAKAGFEVVVFMHGWATAVQDGVQARAVFARDGGHMHMPCTCSHMHMPCKCSHMPITCHAHAHTWHVHVNVVVRAALCDGGLSHARQADRVRVAERQVWCAAPLRAAPSSTAVGRSVARSHVRRACQTPCLDRAGATSFVGGVNSANDTAVQRDFVVFVEGLLAAGVARLHIIAHSMGNRMLLGAVHLLSHVFTSEQSAASRAPSQAPAVAASSRTLPLGSVILLHPEADLDKCAAGSFAAFPSSRSASYPPHLCHCRQAKFAAAIASFCSRPLRAAGS